MAAVIGDSLWLEAPSWYHFHTTGGPPVPGWLVQLANGSGMTGVRRHDKPPAQPDARLFTVGPPLILSARLPPAPHTCMQGSLFFLPLFSLEARVFNFGVLGGMLGLSAMHDNRPIYEATDAGLWRYHQRAWPTYIVCRQGTTP